MKQFSLHGEVPEVALHWDVYSDAGLEVRSTVCCTALSELGLLKCLFLHTF